MSTEAAETIVACIGVYFGVGLLFAVFFSFRAVDRIDPAAREAGLPFRLLILPAAAALWPLLLATTIFAPRAEKDA